MPRADDEHGAHTLVNEAEEEMRQSLQLPEVAVEEEAVQLTLFAGETCTPPREGVPNERANAAAAGAEATMVVNDVEDEVDVLDEDEPPAGSIADSSELNSGNLGGSEPMTDTDGRDGIDGTEELNENRSAAVDPGARAPAFASEVAEARTGHQREEVLPPDDDLDYEYTYVDEDGNEISPEDAEEYEVADLEDEGEAHSEDDDEYEYVYVDEDGNEIDPGDDEYEFIDADDLEDGDAKDVGDVSRSS
jgi:hypothetical protein